MKKLFLNGAWFYSWLIGSAAAAVYGGIKTYKMVMKPTAALTVSDIEEEDLDFDAFDSDEE